MMFSVDKVDFCYNQNTPLRTEALQEVSFSVDSGKVIGLIGPSGAGKTCLLRCLAGVLQPTRGKISWDEVATKGEIRASLAIQEPEQQFFMGTVEEEVGFGLGTKISGSQRQELISQVLQEVGFIGDLSASPFQLSGGQQRRLALASILIVQPQVLLLDEPTIGLDGAGLTMLRQVIAKFSARGKTVVISSHDLDFLYDTAERFLLLNGGRLVADFNRSDFMSQCSLLGTLGMGLPELVTLEIAGFPVEKVKS